jgi:hypothetical protein
MPLDFSKKSFSLTTIKDQRYRSSSVENEWLPVTQVDHTINRAASGEAPLTLRTFRTGRGLLEYVCLVGADSQHPNFDSCSSNLSDGYYLSTLWSSDSVVDPLPFATSIRYGPKYYLIICGVGLNSKCTSQLSVAITWRSFRSRSAVVTSTR